MCFMQSQFACNVTAVVNLGSDVWFLALFLAEHTSTKYLDVKRILEDIHLTRPCL